MVPGVFRDTQVNCLYTTCYSDVAMSTPHEGMELYPVQLRPLPQAHAPAIQPHSSQGSSSSSTGTYKPSQLGTSMCHSAQDRAYYIPRSAPTAPAGTRSCDSAALIAAFELEQHGHI
jgi:hypothetical protein